ncbi:MAG: hypothetical protein IID54_07425, partial [Proteobacteria bacterium]|nr:hypothetical protein [Pseudomonadota bacterium]
MSSGFSKKGLVHFSTRFALICLGLALFPSRPAFAAPDAAESYLAMGKDVADGKLGSLWDWLPSRYQSDIQSLTTQFGQSIDPEVYQKSFGAVAKLARIMESKRDMLLASSITKMAPPEQQKKIGEIYDSLARMIKSITQSELKDLANFHALDVRGLMASLGPQFMDDWLSMARNAPDEASRKPYTEALAEFDRIKHTTARVIRTEGDMATVQMEQP